ncbi:MAG: zinc dependent phospholipase C family protein [Nitrospinae bacterium]|nr:zinc dependent phospholipase C family protein [Nitrospinota bacterium]
MAGGYTHLTLVRSAIAHGYDARLANPEANEWRQQFAWLIGFVSHVIADVTVHPVVNIKVGKYEGHKKEHRLCEMNQDVWIYKQIVGLDLHVSDNMKGEIRSCGTHIDLDDGVEELWSTCFKKAYGREPREDQIDWWHTSFIPISSGVVFQFYR